jgi:hypothetical protein
VSAAWGSWRGRRKGNAAGPVYKSICFIFHRLYFLIDDTSYYFYFFNVFSILYCDRVFFIISLEVGNERENI